MKLMGARRITHVKMKIIAMLRYSVLNTYEYVLALLLHLMYLYISDTA